MNKEGMTYEEYVKAVDERIGGLLPNEESEIVAFLYEDNWSVNACFNHCDSVRRFNKTIKEK